MYNQDSRIKNSMKNIIVSLVGQLTKELMAFIVRTVFIYTLADEYLGVNGLFTNILSFLSLAEMGVGSALIFSMYKPMAEHDECKLKMYMDVYRKTYIMIGFLVLFMGLALTPFLDFFMLERPDIPNLEWIYILYVVNTSSTYFFSYKGSIFQADQRAFVVTNNTTIFNIIMSIIRIVVLLLTRNFIAYLTFSIVVVFVQNFWLARKADKAYPFIKGKCEEALPAKEMHALKKNIGALLLHKIGAVVLNSSDNLIISKYVGVFSVGLYSNYSLIINAVKVTFDMVFGAVGTSIGNLCAKEKTEKIVQVHNAFLLLNIWSGFFCVTCLFNLLNPFVFLWLGEKYLFPTSTVLVIMISFYIQVTMRTGEMFKSASGLFWFDRYAPVCQCVLNVVISIILSKKYDIMGIFIGTSVAMLLTKWWITPYVLFKHKFRKSLCFYFKYYCKYTLMGLVSFAFTTICVGLIQPGTLRCFILKVLFCAVMPNLIFILLTFKTDEFQYCLNLVMRGKLEKYVRNLKRGGKAG